MAFWDDLRMGKKLALGFGAVAAIGLALGLGGVYGISRLSRELEFVGKNRIPDLRNLADLNYLRMEARSQTQAVAQVEGDRRSEEIAALRKDREVTFQKIDAAWQALVSVPRHTEKGRQILALLKVQYGGWRDQHRGIDQLLDRLTQAPSEDRRQEVLKQYRAAMDHLLPLSDAMGNTLVSLVENNNAVTAQLVKEDMAMADWIKRISAIFTGVGLVMTILLGWGITRGVSAPIGVGVSLLARMGRGDLTQDVPPEFISRGDEIGDLARAVQELSEDLRLQVFSLKDATAVLGATSSQIAASAAQVTAGAEETAVAVVETTASVEEIRATAEATTRKTREVAEHTQQGLLLVQEGRKATEELTGGIQRVSTQMAFIAETIVKLSEQSQEIGEITGTVEELAEQSNLLAVNAAVEAARAGDQGRGFSVVAQEIKSLAEQSKEAAKRVQRILKDIQKATAAAVMATEQGSKAVDQARASAPSRESLQGMSRSFAESAQSAAQIAAANAELLSGVDQAAQAMASIREAGHQNVEGMREMENAAQGLKDLGQRIADLVGRYALKGDEERDGQAAWDKRPSTEDEDPSPRAWG